MVYLKLFLFLLYASILSGCAETPERKPNLLLLYMDDLRPQLSCYGRSHMQTPNIDALAREGILFANAYCNVAVCGASRASMLTGIRPTKNIFRDYKVFVQEDAPNAVTLPQLFKENGYTTISNGKIYHHLDDREGDWDEIWRPYAFDENPEGLAPTDWWQSLWRDYLLPENDSVYRETNRGPAYEKAAVPDSAYIDGLLTQKVMRDLERLKESKQPFFLTAGFISPHLPFNAPARHWDRYPEGEIHQPYNNFVAKNAPAISNKEPAELYQYNGIPRRPEMVGDSLARTLIHGYYATVSYVDALIGEILGKLKTLELDQNTIVVFVSDHGYNLQEHTLWAKWTSHRTSMQVPLIISAPGLPKNRTTDALVELVDIYPTLADLCGLEIPKGQIEGESLLPILKDPDVPGKAHILINNRNGYTLKTPKYCYTEFIRPEDDKTIARMLYDHEFDPDENENISEMPGMEEVVSDLHRRLFDSYGANIFGK